MDVVDDVGVCDRGRLSNLNSIALRGLVRRCGAAVQRCSCLVGQVVIGPGEGDLVANRGVCCGSGQLDSR